jgi:Pyruvate/2-oxoacid:ferredoxin oxidoreductase delta subunit
LRPAVDHGRCVHSGRIVASCVACLAACPRLALRLDRGAPEIVAEDCDGCGLCIAACPRGALAMPLLIARGELAGHAACFAACEQVLDTPLEGRVACLHAIGLEAVLRALRAGIRLWLVARGDCHACARGRRPGLPETLARLNEALRARGDPGIVMMETDAARWSLAHAARGAPRRARRAFLSGAQEHAPEHAEPTRACFAGAGPVPHAIHFDQARCVACHACARVCPDGAIRLEADAPAYLLEHAACSGCGLCADVCDRGAVRVLDWMPGGAAVLPLRAEVCDACGTTYHALTDAPRQACAVCAERPARRRPDRVWE